MSIKVGRNDPCSCGSGKKFKKCHGNSITEAISSSFYEVPKLSIKERNMILLGAIYEIFGTNRGVTWEQVKRTISAKQVRDLYEVIAKLWPPNTNLDSLLPKDNKLRALYLGEVEPQFIGPNIFRFGLYADELIVIDPFLDPYGTVGGLNPIMDSEFFKADTLKLIYFVNTVAPWIQAGLLSIIPNPIQFKPDLYIKFVEMAKERIGDKEIPPEMLEEFWEVKKESLVRMYAELPPEVLKNELKSNDPNITDEEVNEILEGLKVIQQQDPLALEQTTTGTKGQVQSTRGGANLENALYISQLTGAFPYTNLSFRWKELLSVANELPNDAQTWTPLTRAFQDLDFKFLSNFDSKFACEMRNDGRLESFRTFLRKVWRTVGGQPDINKIDSLARDFSDELKDEYHKAEVEWSRIERDLILWLGTSLGSAATGLGGILTGNLMVGLPALGFCIAGVSKLFSSRIEKKKEFPKKVPMSVFIDLSKRGK